MLYWIDVGYVCFGLVAENGIITEAPPIARWAIKKKVNYVLDYYKNKKNGVIWEINQYELLKTFIRPELSEKGE